MIGVKGNGVGGREAQRAVGERSAAAADSDSSSRVPDPELTERPRRRRFTAEYKLHMLKEAGACRRPGELGALLRREGLYTSHLTTWRRQRDQGALVAWRRPRGRPKSNPLAVETAKRRQRAERAEAPLAKAQQVIDIQGKLSALLEAWLETKRAAPAAPTKAHAR